MLIIRYIDYYQSILLSVENEVKARKIKIILVNVD
jgi:hypothetical protein